MSLGRFLIQTVRSDAPMRSPQADDQQRRKRQETGEAEAALCPVHIDHDGFDLNREEVRGNTSRATYRDGGSG
jgi:hypothetical protein